MRKFHFHHSFKEGHSTIQTHPTKSQATLSCFCSFPVRVRGEILEISDQFFIDVIEVFVHRLLEE